MVKNYAKKDLKEKRPPLLSDLKIEARPIHFNSKKRASNRLVIEAV